MVLGVQAVEQLRRRRFPPFLHPISTLDYNSFPGPMLLPLYSRGSNSVLDLKILVDFAVETW